MLRITDQHAVEIGYFFIFHLFGLFTNFDQYIWKEKRRNGAKSQSILSQYSRHSNRVRISYVIHSFSGQSY